MKAYVLVKTRDPKGMKEYLGNVEWVKEVHLVYGGYDLVAVVDVSSLDQLGKVVLEEIRARFPVEETMTLITAD